MVILQQYFYYHSQTAVNKNFTKNETYDTIPIPKHYLWK